MISQNTNSEYGNNYRENFLYNQKDFYSSGISIFNSVTQFNLYKDKIILLNAPALLSVTSPIRYTIPYRTISEIIIKNNYFGKRKSVILKVKSGKDGDNLFSKSSSFVLGSNLELTDAIKLQQVVLTLKSKGKIDIEGHSYKDSIIYSDVKSLQIFRAKQSEEEIIDTLVKQQEEIHTITTSNKPFLFFFLCLALVIFLFVLLWCYPDALTI